MSLAIDVPNMVVGAQEYIVSPITLTHKDKTPKDDAFWLQRAVVDRFGSDTNAAPKWARHQTFLRATRYGLTHP